MKFLILLALISVAFAAEYEYVGKQACYAHCEKFFKGQTQAKCFDKCSAMLSDAEKVPKKELCLLGCKMLKKDWQKQLCEVACNQIKDNSSESDFFGPAFEQFGKKIFKQAKKFVSKSNKLVKPKSEGFPKKELCLIGCKALKKDWQQQLCEIACNQIKESSDVQLFGRKFNKFLKKGLKIGEKMGKEYIKTKIPLSDAEKIPKKELCLLGCSMLKGWKKSICEIACEKVESDSEFSFKKIKKALKKGLSVGKKLMKMPGVELIPGLGQLKGMTSIMNMKNLKDIKKGMKLIKGLKGLKAKDIKKLLKAQGKKFLKSQGKKFLKSKGLPMSEGFPKKELCLIGCKALKKEWQQQLCEIACNQIKESSDKFNFKKLIKKITPIAKELGKEYLKKQIPIPMSADYFDGKPKPQPTPCQVCKSTCVRNQMNIGQCLSKCDSSDCKLTPSDICKQKCIASQFNIPECMKKC